MFFFEGPDAKKAPGLSFCKNDRSRASAPSPPIHAICCGRRRRASFQTRVWNGTHLQPWLRLLGTCLQGVRHRLEAVARRQCFSQHHTRGRSPGKIELIWKMNIFYSMKLSNSVIKSNTLFTIFITLYKTTQTTLTPS